MKFIANKKNRIKIESFSKIITVALYYLLSTYIPAKSQVIPDTTLGQESSVTNTKNIEGLSQVTVTGGSIRGTSLFHSFSDFSIVERSAVYFNDPGVDNIAARVTGAQVSSINGILGVLGGNASLILINPNGIILGENAILDLKGSFLATTADYLQLKDGTQFSARDPKALPIMTVSVPIGLGFDSGSAGTIEVVGGGHNIAVEETDEGEPIELTGSLQPGIGIRPGNEIALIGGPVRFTGGIINAFSGDITISSVHSGYVNIYPSPTKISFGFDSVQEFEDILFSEKSLLDASGFIDGHILIQGKDITITDASIISVSSFGSSNGDITIKASDQIDMIGITSFVNSTLTEGSIVSGGIISINTPTSNSKGPNINIFAGSLNVQDSATIISVTYGDQPGGDININLLGDISLLSPSLFSATIFGGNITTATVGIIPDAGMAGDISIDANNLYIEDGAFLSSGTYGNGDGGSVTVNVNESVVMFGETNIVANPELAVDDYSGSLLGSYAIDSGDAGNLYIKSQNLIVEAGAQINSSTYTSGDAGDININSENIIIRGVGPNSFEPSKIASEATLENTTYNLIFNINEPPTGKAGSIFINSNNLLLDNNAQISVSNEGAIASAGTINIESGDITLGGDSSISANTNSGEGGNINLINDGSVILNDDSSISTSSLGTGNGGNISIISNSLFTFPESTISANSNFGSGGRVSIQSNLAFISPDSKISATSALGPEFNGVIQINTSELEPDKDLIKLGELLSQPEIYDGCANDSGSEMSSFTISGKGGTPIAPHDLYSMIGWVDRKSPHIKKMHTDDEPKKLSSEERIPIIEAQRIETVNGRKILTGAALPLGFYASRNRLSCASLKSIK
jgi:filamentous hemagglutinin family protein